MVNSPDIQRAIDLRDIAHDTDPNAAYEWLEEAGVSEEALILISSINGHNVETYQNVLFARFGYRTFAQAEGE